MLQRSLSPSSAVSYGSRPPRYTSSISPLLPSFPDLFYNKSLSTSTTLVPCPTINLSIFRRYSKSWRLATSCSQPPSCLPLPYFQHWCRVELSSRRLSRRLFRRVGDSRSRARNRHLVRLRRTDNIGAVSGYHPIDFTTPREVGRRERRFCRYRRDSHLAHLSRLAVRRRRIRKCSRIPPNQFPLAMPAAVMPLTAPELPVRSSILKLQR